MCAQSPIRHRRGSTMPASRTAADLVMRYSASALPIEDPSMLTGEYRTLASADEPGRRTPEHPDRKTKRQIPAYYKAGVVGCGLILLIVAVVGVAYMNV